VLLYPFFPPLREEWREKREKKSVREGKRRGNIFLSIPVTCAGEEKYKKRGEKRKSARNALKFPKEKVQKERKREKKKKDAAMSFKLNTHFTNGKKGEKGKGG